MLTIVVVVNRVQPLDRLVNEVFVWFAAVKRAAFN